MSLYHLIFLPIKTSSSFILDQVGNHLSIDLITYQRLIGKLIYLAYEMKPDIVFVVG